MTLKDINFSVAMYGTTAISASTYPVVYTGDEASANVRFTVTDEPDLTGATAKAHFYFADSHHIERDLILDGLVFNYTLVGTENDHAGIARTDIMITLGGATFTRAGYKFRVDTSLEASAPLVDYAVDTLDTLVDGAEEWLLQAQTDFGTAQGTRAAEWVSDNDTRADDFNAAQTIRATTFGESETARTSTFNTNETSRSNTFTTNENARQAAAEANQAQAATDHTTASADHTTAVADSSLASSDHGTAVADHSTAVVDHSTASADHTAALADQGIVDGLQDQFDAVIANATVDSEVINARQGSATLSQNLLSIKSELAENTTDIFREKTKSNYLRYGLLNYPAIFTHPGVNIRRDVDGIVRHDFSVEVYQTAEKEIYFDTATGADSTGDGTQGLPYKTLVKALEQASLVVESTVIIKALSPVLSLGQFSSDNVRVVIPVGKTISIVPSNSENKIQCINGRNNTNGLTWIADSGIYKTARSVCKNVIDFNRLDAYGVPIPLIKKTTLSECITMPFSWYTDGTTVWVNGNGIAPDSDVWTVLDTWNFTIDITGSTLYMENVEFYNGSTVTASCDVKGDLSSVFVANKCIFTGGDIFTSTGSAGNGLSIVSVGKSYLFGCIASHTALDGFNYHYGTIAGASRRNCIVFEYDCIAYKNGVYKTLQNNNATTAHYGVTVFRVNCIGFETNGPILADVAGCNVFAIDCHMRKSLINNTSSGTSCAFYFDNGSAFEPGVAYLENCDGGGLNTYALGSDGTFDIKLLGFNGSGKVLNSTWAKTTSIEDIV